MKKEMNLTVFGVGYNSGAISHNNGVALKSYKIWMSMLQRCYSERFKEIYKYSNDYDGVTVCDEWKDYKNFKKWYEDNYYEVEGYRMAIDKDLLKVDNKVYSPSTCCIIPQCINSLLAKKKKRDLPVGVNRSGSKFVACCIINGKRTHLGTFDTPEEAGNAYIVAKKQVITDVANKYIDVLPSNVYNALINYQL